MGQLEDLIKQEENYAIIMENAYNNTEKNADQTRLYVDYLKSYRSGLLNINTTLQSNTTTAYLYGNTIKNNADKVGQLNDKIAFLEGGLGGTSTGFSNLTEQAGISNGVLDSVKKTLDNIKSKKVTLDVDANVSKATSAFKNLFNNNLSKGIESIFKGMGLNIKLPKLAVGGIVNMPGRGINYGGANIAERGAEGVIPLTNSQMMAELGQAIGRYVNINNQTVTKQQFEINNTELDGEELISDTKAPVLQSINIVSPVTGYYGLGNEIVFEATFDENVYDENANTLISEKAPTLEFESVFSTETNVYNANFTNAKNNKITYSYTVKSDELVGEIKNIFGFEGIIYDELGNSSIITKPDSLGGSKITVDTDIPNWKYLSKEVFYTDKTLENDEVVNKERTVKITFKGSDVLWYKENTLGNLENTALIKVLVNGQDITENVTKTLSDPYEHSERYDSETNITVVEYTLTITGITGDGALSIVIPENTIEDMAGNKNVAATFSTDLSIDADNTKPEYSGLEVVTPENGKYKAGQDIEFKAKFSNEVLYSNPASTEILTKETAPILKIKFSESSEKTVTCTNVNGNEITYTYKVTSGDNGDLEVVSYIGTIYDRAGNALEINSRVINENNIVADTKAPELNSIKIISPENGTYKIGEKITIEAEYSENIYSTSGEILKENSAPTLKIKLDEDIEKEALFKVADGSTLTYEYVIEAGDNGKILTSSYTGTVYDNAKTENDTNGNSLSVSVIDFAQDSKTIVADTKSPELQAIEVISPDDGIYKAGQTVTMVAKYNENVYGQEKTDLTETSAPKLNIKLGNGEIKQAKFKEVNGKEISYTYDITEGDNGLLQTVSYEGSVYDFSEALEDKNGNKLDVSNMNLSGKQIESDTTLPTWTYVSKKVFYAEDEAGNDQYVNAERIVKITIRGTDTNYNKNTLESKLNEFKVLVNGAPVSANVSITSQKDIENGEELVLQITGITSDGQVSIVIPEGSIEDRAIKTEDASGNKNIATTISADLSIDADNTSTVLESINILNPTTDTYKAGQEITIVATYKDEIYADKLSKEEFSSSTAPVLNVKFGNGGVKEARFNSFNFSAKTITYKVYVEAGDNGILSINSYEGTVYDRAGNALEVEKIELTGNEITADTETPTLESIKVVSPDTGIYREGQEIEIEAKYSENIYAEERQQITSETAPVLNIKFGEGEEKQTTYVEISGNIITYKYTVIAGDNGELKTTDYTGRVYDISKTENDEIGNRILVEGGNVLAKEEAASQKGTTITVSNLFFNTPVRYKFLKKDYTEAGYIEDVVSKMALIHSDIAFKYINSKKVIIQTNGDGNIIKDKCKVYDHGEELNLEDKSVVYHTGINKDDMIEALEDGQVLICKVSDGDFATEEHFIVIRDYKKGFFYINDPMSAARSVVGWDFKRLRGQIGKMCALEAGAVEDSTEDSTETIQGRYDHEQNKKLPFRPVPRSAHRLCLPCRHRLQRL